MTTPPHKRIAIICRKAPYADSLSREALEIALAASVFNQALTIVFTGDGVWQLLKEQDSSRIKAKNQGKLLSAFPVYEITDIYIDRDALEERQLCESELLIAGTPLPRQSLGQLIDGFDVVLNF